VSLTTVLSIRKTPHLDCCLVCILHVSFYQNCSVEGAGRYSTCFRQWWLSGCCLSTTWSVSCFWRYRAFLAPGANSLPGANRPIGPWPIRSLKLSLPGLFAPRPFRSPALSPLGLFAPGNESTMELSLRGTFVPWNFRSLNVYLTV